MINTFSINFLKLNDLYYFCINLYDFSKIINDQNFQNEISSNANESVKNYLSNTPNNSKTLLSFLENYINET